MITYKYMNNMQNIYIKYIFWSFVLFWIMRVNNGKVEEIFIFCVCVYVCVFCRDCTYYSYNNKLFRINYARTVLDSSGGNFLVRQSSDYVQTVDKFLWSGTSFCVPETSKSFLSCERNWHKIRVHKCYVEWMY